MRYWDEDRPEWSAEQNEFAAAWRCQPKWVVSRSLKSVGPNATLVEDDIEAEIRGLKTRLVGEIAVSDLARSLTDLGLIDEYRLYFQPIVLGRGKPFFAGPRPPLRLVASDLIGEDVIRLTYVPARATGRAVCADASGPLGVISTKDFRDCLVSARTSIADCAGVPEGPRAEVAQHIKVSTASEIAKSVEISLPAIPHKSPPPLTH